MRVISQNGMIDIPYEKFVFAISNDGCIVAVRDSVGRPSEIARGIIAKYSSIKKAKKAMRLLHEAHEIYIVCVNSEKIEPELQLRMLEIVEKGARLMYGGIFQFPKEEDL